MSIPRLIRSSSLLSNRSRIVFGGRIDREKYRLQFVSRVHNKSDRLIFDNDRDKYLSFIIF